MHYQRLMRTGTVEKPERPPCSVDGCGRSVHGYGLCHPHWNRWRKTGMVGGPIRDVTLTVVERFWTKVDKNGPIPEHRPDLGPCWIWLAGLSKGYGHFNAGPGRTQEAHRFAYEEIIGSIPDGLVLDHLCRNPPCVNPHHLDPTTVLENIRRGPENPSMANARKTHSIHGHKFTPENTYIEPGRGKRVCRACKRATWRRRQRKAD